MAIIRKGDALPAVLGAGQGYVISGGNGRIKIGTGINTVYLNLTDFPFEKVTGGLHVHEDNISGLEVLGSAFIDLVPGSGPAAHRLHTGSSVVTNKELLGGKGTVLLQETGEADVELNLYNFTGTIEAGAAITYIAQGSAAFFYIE